MKKYETEFKLEVVQSFLAGEGGAKLLARRWSVPEEKVRTWVSHYRLHGIDGLRPKRSAYSTQFKLQVLVHQDREQLSSRQVADGIPVAFAWPDARVVVLFDSEPEDRNDLKRAGWVVSRAPV